MYSLSYILHIVGVALWIGSFAVIGYLLKILTKNKGLKDFSVIIKRMQKMDNGRCFA